MSKVFASRPRLCSVKLLVKKSSLSCSLTKLIVVSLNFKLMVKLCIKTFNESSKMPTSLSQPTNVMIWVSLNKLTQLMVLSPLVQLSLVGLLPSHALLVSTQKSLRLISKSSCKSFGVTTTSTQRKNASLLRPAMMKVVSSPVVSSNSSWSQSLLLSVMLWMDNLTSSGRCSIPFKLLLTPNKKKDV